MARGAGEQLAGPAPERPARRQQKQACHSVFRWTPRLRPVDENAVKESSGHDKRTPYGPATDVIRNFLVKLAGLDSEAHDGVVARFDALHQEHLWVAADVTLGETLERSGRNDARDAVAGPLLQLIRIEQADDPSVASLSREHALDPIAEPALAAVLALIVSDLLPTATLATLYAPFEPIIPLVSVLLTGGLRDAP